MAAHAVALKLPVFWEQNATAWFAQAEAQFAIREITAEDTKYYYVVASLSSSTATRVVSLLEHPPAQDKYTALKAHLKETFCLSEAERARQLLSLPGLGDYKPSELMDNMLALLGDHRPCFLFRELFLQQLPEQVRSALANSVITDFRQLAKEADTFFSAGKRCFTATHATTPVDPIHPAGSISATAVARRQRPSGLCFYHMKFGSKARKCLPPCNFSESGNATAATR